MISSEYAAGFIDGEGCITLHRRAKEVAHSNSDQYQMIVIVSNTNIEPLLGFSERWGGTIRKLKRYQSHHRQRYNWRLSAHRSMKLLEDILPFLIIKKEVAKLCMEVQRENMQWQCRQLFQPVTTSLEAKRYLIWGKVKKLNQRGIKPNDITTSEAFDLVAVDGGL